MFSNNKLLLQFSVIFQILQILQHRNYYFAVSRGCHIDSQQLLNKVDIKYYFFFSLFSWNNNYSQSLHIGFK